MLIRQRINEQNAQDGDELCVAEAVVEHVPFVFEEHELLVGLIVDLHDDRRTEIVVEEFPDLRYGRQITEGDLLDEQNDEKVACLRNVKILQKDVQRNKIRGDHFVNVGAGRHSESRDNNCIEKNVEETSIQNVHLVARKSHSVFGSR